MDVALDGSLRVDLGEAGSDRGEILLEPLRKGLQLPTARDLNSLEPPIQVLSASGAHHGAEGLYEVIDRAYGAIAREDLRQVIPLPLREPLRGFGEQDGALSGRERG